MDAELLPPIIISCANLHCENMVYISAETFDASNIKEYVCDKCFIEEAKKC
jgi:hypothetical protein